MLKEIINKEDKDKGKGKEKEVAIKTKRDKQCREYEHYWRKDKND